MKLIYFRLDTAINDPLVLLYAWFHHIHGPSHKGLRFDLKSQNIMCNMDVKDNDPKDLITTPSHIRGGYHSVKEQLQTYRCTMANQLHLFLYCSIVEPVFLCFELYSDPCATTIVSRTGYFLNTICLKLKFSFVTLKALFHIAKPPPRFWVNYVFTSVTWALICTTYFTFFLLYYLFIYWFRWKNWVSHIFSVG